VVPEEDEHHQQAVAEAAAPATEPYLKNKLKYKITHNF
jgi:hypothetical protein